jgi:DNA-binding response OmpR family regulator
MEAEKILLVDTEKNVLLTYKTALEEEGYKVDIAKNEDEVLSKLAENTYSILITELYLKNTTTFKIIDLVLKNDPETYIIVLTAGILSPNIYEKVISAGVQDCFLKPFPIQNLLLYIKKGLERRQLIIKMRELEKKVRMIENVPSEQSIIINEKKNFLKIFQQEHRRCERYKHPFSVVILDFNFSASEDPIVSSKLIKEFFSVLSSSVRCTDYSSQLNHRCGFILPETTQSDTQHFTSRFSEIINAYILEKDSDPYSALPQRMRFSIATYPDNSEKMNELITSIDTTF